MPGPQHPGHKKRKNQGQSWSSTFLVGKAPGEHSRNHCHLEMQRWPNTFQARKDPAEHHLETPAWLLVVRPPRCQAPQHPGHYKMKNKPFFARAGQAHFWWGKPLRNILETTATWRCRGGQIPFRWGKTLVNITWRPLPGFW